MEFLQYSVKDWEFKGTKVNTAPPRDRIVLNSSTPSRAFEAPAAEFRNRLMASESIAKSGVPHIF
jgi:hypothetical protein